ncbi:MAG: hypothetical protein JG760_1264 [Desulfomicrobiaceae bacterium]|nr:hypothetical protein [Desulfomicrobiaceae bacterium]
MDGGGLAKGAEGERQAAKAPGQEDRPGQAQQKLEGRPRPGQARDLDLHGQAMGHEHQDAQGGGVQGGEGGGQGGEDRKPAVDGIDHGRGPHQAHGRRQAEQGHDWGERRSHPGHEAGVVEELHRHHRGHEDAHQHPPRLGGFAKHRGKFGGEKKDGGGHGLRISA